MSITEGFVALGREDSPVILLRTFLVGLGFGWVYLRTGRLFPLILGHWLTNLAAGFWMLAFR